MTEKKEQPIKITVEMDPLVFAAYRKIAAANGTSITQAFSDVAAVAEGILQERNNGQEIVSTGKVYKRTFLKQGKAF